MALVSSFASSTAILAAATANWMTRSDRLASLPGIQRVGSKSLISAPNVTGQSPRSNVVMGPMPFFPSRSAFQ